MEPIRENFIEKFNTILDNADLSRNIEESCYTYTCDYCKKKNVPTNLTNYYFKDVYVCKLRQLYVNLVKHKHLIELLKNGNINVLKIADMSYTELCPKKWKQYTKDLEIMNQEIFNNNVEQSETDQFQCGKCKQRRCTYYSLQTRSADEPMTNFITCLNCGNNWRD